MKLLIAAIFTLVMTANSQAQLWQWEFTQHTANTTWKCSNNGTGRDVIEITMFASLHPTSGVPLPPGFTTTHRAKLHLSQKHDAELISFDGEISYGTTQDLYAPIESTDWKSAHNNQKIVADAKIPGTVTVEQLGDGLAMRRTWKVGWQVTGETVKFENGDWVPKTSHEGQKIIVLCPKPPKAGGGR